MDDPNRSPWEITRFRRDGAGHVAGSHSRGRESSNVSASSARSPRRRASAMRIREALLDLRHRQSSHDRAPPRSLGSIEPRGQLRRDDVRSLARREGRSNRPRRCFRRVGRQRRLVRDQLVDLVSERLANARLGSSRSPPCRTSSRVVILYGSACGAVIRTYGLCPCVRLKRLIDPMGSTPEI